ncbi:hypothetical protein U1708_07860 [Sphingomonas sp. ZB1N12]
MSDKPQESQSQATSGGISYYADRLGSFGKRTIYRRCIVEGMWEWLLGRERIVRYERARANTAGNLSNEIPVRPSGSHDICAAMKV